MKPDPLKPESCANTGPVKLHLRTRAGPFKVQLNCAN
jgi:hypothetical protein